MSPVLRRVLLGLLALLLLVAPLVVRSVFWSLNRRGDYQAQVPAADTAATPAPTNTPVPLAAHQATVNQELRPGPVVVDLAHGNRLNRNQFEPLAAALAQRGVGMRFWLGEVDILQVTSFADYPDQSEELSRLLEDATALVVASPYFLWSRAEISLVERFVADGGHLLLVSDPDVMGDLAQDINNLAEPFGVVFNDDYLYDTTTNDGNFTYVFQEQFVDTAALLAGKEIVLYGARSIGGEVAPQVRSAVTTLSSVRPGVSGFTTVALGGLNNSSTAWRVMAMTDFDVITRPYVERHDNQLLVEFVAGFLASAQRRDTVTDFPAYLGKEVALIFGNATAVDAQILLEGSRLQESLEMSGRSLTLRGSTLLTSTLIEGAPVPPVDLIALADFTMMDEQTSLLANLGFDLVKVTPTPEAGAAAEPTPTPALPGPGVGMTGTGSLTETGSMTATATPELPGPDATATPEPEVYLQKADGLRLVASQTVIITQLQLDEGHRLVAVMGDDSAGIRAGVDRLLTRNYEGCVTGPDLVVCSFEGSPTPTATPEVTPDAEGAPAPAITPQATLTATVPGAPGQPTTSVLVVDDNDMVNLNDPSEADIYLQALTQQGYQPVLWTTGTQGTPSTEEMGKYQWVIWSSGGYENGGPGVADLDALLGYINTGGNLTISSRRPFFGMGTDDPSVIADVVISNDLPALVTGLPSEGIELKNGLPPVVPLEVTGEGNGPKIALRRGPNSGAAGAPLLFLATDEGDGQTTAARLMVLGMSLTWLPDDFGNQLVRNMADVMLAPP